MVGSGHREHSPADRCPIAPRHRLLNDIVATVAAWVVSVISASGSVGVAGLMAVGSTCLPLPSEVIMPFAGYLASTGRFSLGLIATAGAVGCHIGSTIAYRVGAKGGRRFVERWGGGSRAIALRTRWSSHTGRSSRMRDSAWASRR